MGKEKKSAAEQVADEAKRRHSILWRRGRRYRTTKPSQNSEKIIYVSELTGWRVGLT
jgi:hypothetical protein